MARPTRNDVFNPDEVATVHVYNRCARGLFLMGIDELSGNDYSYRREIFRLELVFCSELFAIDTLEHSILSNHFHMLLRSRPDIARCWSNSEVARRWLTLCPKRKKKDGSPKAPTKAEIKALTKDANLIKDLRRRLSDISWMVRLICQRVAQKANAETNEKGKFWDGRFHATRLVDEQAVLACSAYINLNPIRAGMAQTLEDSDFTSVQQRMKDFQSSFEVCPERYMSFPENTLDDTLAGDLVSGDLISGDLISGDLISGDLISGDLISGGLVAAELVGGELLGGELVGGRGVTETSAVDQVYQDVMPVGVVPVELASAEVLLVDRANPLASPLAIEPAPLDPLQAREALEYQIQFDAQFDSPVDAQLGAQVDVQFDAQQDVQQDVQFDAQADALSWLPTKMLAELEEGEEESPEMAALRMLPAQPDCHSGYLAPLEIVEPAHDVGPCLSRSQQRCSDRGYLRMTEAQYLELLDWSARLIRPDKRGFTPADTPPLFQRLGLTIQMWKELVQNFDKLFSVIAGMPVHVDAHRGPRQRYYLPDATRELLTGPPAAPADLASSQPTAQEPATL